MLEHFLLQGGIVTHTSSSKCNESLASAQCQHTFLVKMCRVQGLMSSEADEYQGMTVITQLSEVIQRNSLCSLPDFSQW